MTQNIDNNFFKTFIDALPSSVFIVDKDFKICDMNQEVRKLFKIDSDDLIEKLCGLVFNCRYAIDAITGCGTATNCADCVVRNSVQLAGIGKSTYKQKHQLKVQKNGINSVSHILVTASAIEIDSIEKILLVIEDITEMTLLRKMLPICSSCKKIRNDENYWDEVSDYLSNHTDLEFTHSICPSCVKKIYPDLKL